MKAFNNDPDLKTKLQKRMRKHIQNDELVRTLGWYLWKNPQGRIVKKEVFWCDEDNDLVTTAANGWIIDLEGIGGDWIKMFE